MKRKRLARTGLLLVSAVFLLTACGNSKSAPEATTQAPQEEELVIDYSAGLTKEGKLEGINAADYVTLCDYDKIKIARKEIEPTDDEVLGQIDNLLSNSAYGDRESAVKDGDTVNIDYTGTIDGVQFSGGTATDQSLEIGSKTFIDDFEEQIIGHKPGETFDVNVTFPEDYSSEEVAGKDAVFSVTLNYIVPELTDKFVETYFSESDGISTVKELKNSIKDNLRDSNKNTYLWDYLMTNSTFKDLPEDLMETRLNVSLDTLRKQYHDYMGYGDEEILSMYGYESLDEVKENLRENTETSLKYFLISDVISQEKGLSVTQEALDQYLGEGNAQSYYDTYGEPYTNANILVTIVSDYLVEHAKVK